MGEFWGHFRSGLRPWFTVPMAGVGAACAVVAKLLEQPRVVSGGMPESARASLELQYAIQFAASKSTEGWFAGILFGLVTGFLLGLLAAWAYDQLKAGWQADQEELDARPLRAIKHPYHWVRGRFEWIGHTAGAITGMGGESRRMRLRAGEDARRAMGDAAVGVISTPDGPGLVLPEPPPMSRRDRVMTVLMYGFAILVWMGFLQFFFAAAFYQRGSGYASFRMSDDVALALHGTVALIGLVTGLIWANRRQLEKPKGFGAVAFDPLPAITDRDVPMNVRLAPTVAEIRERHANAPESALDLWRRVVREARESTAPRRRATAVWQPPADLVAAARDALDLMLMVGVCDSRLDFPEYSAAMETALGLSGNAASPGDLVPVLDAWASGRSTPPETRAAEEEAARRAAGHFAVADRRALLVGCARVAASHGGISERERTMLRRIAGWMGLDVQECDSAMYAVRREAEASKQSESSSKQARPGGEGLSAPAGQPVTRRQAWVLAGVPRVLVDKITFMSPPKGLPELLLTPGLQVWQRGLEAASKPGISPLVAEMMQAQVERYLAAIRVLGGRGSAVAGKKPVAAGR